MFGISTILSPYKVFDALAAPALEEMTDRIYERTKTISEVKYVQLLDFDIDSLGTKVLIKEQFKVSQCRSRVAMVILGSQ